MAGQPNFRFAVGAFDTWQHLRNALDDVRLRGLALDSFNCVALERLFAGKIIMAPSQEPVALRKLDFPDSRQPICCTAGPLAERLAGRLDAGAPSLTAALGHWLLPRHAAHFERAVESGHILLWIQLYDADGERRAYQSLLAHSSSSVGVHDLVQ